jgi:uncharacterized protein (DUF952 family)
MMEDNSADPSPLYHICRRVDWQAGADGGLYRAPESDRADGFLHFSTAGQIVESAARHRAGQCGLVLIEIDAANLGRDLRWETSRNGALFPHLYGPIPLAAVTVVHDLPLGPDGLHIFPEIG